MKRPSARAFAIERVYAIGVELPDLSLITEVTQSNLKATIKKVRRFRESFPDDNEFAPTNQSLAIYLERVYGGQPEAADFIKSLDRRKS